MVIVAYKGSHLSEILMIGVGVGLVICACLLEVVARGDCKWGSSVISSSLV